MEVKIIKSGTKYIANVMTRTNNINIDFECNIVKNKLFVKILNNNNVRLITQLIKPINNLFNNKYELPNKNISININNKLIPLNSLQSEGPFFNNIIVDNDTSIDSTSSRKRRRSFVEENVESNSKRSCGSDNKYLGASNTKYFQSNDILGYNLKLLKINNVNSIIDFVCSNPEMYKEQITNTSINTSYSNRSNNEIMNYIYDRGIEFEKYICEKIKILCSKYHLSYLEVVNGNPNYNNYNEYLDLTKNAMNKEIDIIYQGMIQSPQTSKYKFRGFPDLLVSKKAFKLLFLDFIDKSNNFEVSLDVDLNKNINDYIVIDIKSSTILLNADGKTARNTGLLKYYKSQLATYGYIMKSLNPKKDILTYILPYSLKMEYIIDKQKYETTIINPVKSLDKYCLINIDIENKDNEYYLNLNNIYNLYLDCLNKYESYTKNTEYKFLYEEQIEELNEMYSNDDYINLEKVKKCNKLLSIDANKLRTYDFSNYDIPFVRNNIMSDRLSIKYWIAKQTRSLSLLRGFNHKELLMLKEQGIYSYLQTNEIIKYLDNRHEKRSDINLIKSIVLANSEIHNKMIYCNNIKSKLEEFNSKFLNKRIICCLDFETIPLKLINNRELLYEVSEEDDETFIKTQLTQKIFMIGCNFYKNENGIFNLIKQSQFTLDRIYDDNNKMVDIDNDIYKLFIGLEKEINLVRNSNNIYLNDMAFVIWSPYEISLMKQLKQLNSYGRGKFKMDFKTNNASLFNIKIIDLMKVFSSNDNPIGIRGAFDCSIKSIANGYYVNGFFTDKQMWSSDNIVNGYDAMYYSLWYYCDKDNEKYKKIFEKIKNYNMTDCSIMNDIINTTYKLLNK